MAISDIRAALLTGIDDYTNLSDLRYCGNDATQLANTLGHVAAFGLQRSGISTLTNAAGAPPDRHSILSALADRIAHLGPGDGFLFYFAGHGIEIDGEPYILPSDYDPSVPTLTAIPISDLMSEIRRRKIGLRVFIFDSCYSGLHRGERSPDEEAFGKYASSFSQALDPADEGAAVLSSASISEKARERRFGQEGHGIYTNSILETLNRLNQESRRGSDVHIEDLHRHCYEATVLLSDGKQHPRFFYSAGSPITVFRASGTRPKRKAVERDEVELRKLLRGLSRNNTELQKVAAEKLIRYGAAAVEDLVERLGHSREDVRNWAAYALGEINAEEAIKPLVAGLRDRQLKKRHEPLIPEATHALRRFGPAVVQVCWDYINQEKLNSHEEIRILHAILPAWDPKGNKLGRELFNYLRGKFPYGIASCRDAPFLRKSCLALLETILKEIELEQLKRFKLANFVTYLRLETIRDLDWLSADPPDVLFSALVFLLRTNQVDAETMIITHDAFRSSRPYLQLVLAACEIGNSPLAASLSEKVLKAELLESADPS